MKLVEENLPPSPFQEELFRRAAKQQQQMLRHEAPRANVWGGAGFKQLDAPIGGQSYTAATLGQLDVRP